MKKLYFILLVLAFILPEIMLNVNKYAGVLIYAVIIGFILFDIEEYEFMNNSEKLLIFLMIIPLARISEFFINFNFFWKTAIFYFVICFLVILYTGKFRINPRYTKSKLWFLPISIIIGICLSYIGSLYFDFGNHFELVFLIPFIVFSEEILFRGMIQNIAKKEYGSMVSVICVSLLFAIFSLSFGFKFAYFMFAANLIMCLVYDRTENIWLTIPINLCINLFLFVMHMPYL
ncbi:MAG: CPBP family glutamic-type intramembrane protease [Candidatus Nanoarchaeia archaeon]|nr:CPBP family glutamic-type intramembrane protease [Candidatus Nanoarchaeia archaeon]MDD5740562.1 CPBP family glutamic-type intramembrane protease [Candidatus Nanoarchaeia archaeon]